MRIKLNALLTEKDGKEVVVITLGSNLLAVIPTLSESDAQKGDDSMYWQSEEERVILEAVTPYLVRVFSAQEEPVG